MDVELTTLGFLMSGPKTVYRLKTISSKMMMFYSITLNQIYPTLRKLESAGYIKKEIVFQTDKPNKHLYSLTPAGVQYFHEKMTGPAMPVDINIPSLVKTFFFRFLDTAQVINEFEKDIRSLEEAIDDLLESEPQVEEKADDFGKFIFKTTVSVLETLQSSFTQELDKYRTGSEDQ